MTAGSMAAPARRWRFERTATPSPLLLGALSIVAVLVTFAVAGIFLLATGHSPFRALTDIWQGSFGDGYSFSETLLEATPLILIGLGIGLAYRMSLWNIGGEGQFYMGAFAATGIGLHLAWHNWTIVPAMMAGAILAGGLWAAVPALLRAYLDVSEIITTLLLNYVAILWVDYFVFGPWRDPAELSFPITHPLPGAAQLPTFGGTRVNLSFVFALAAAAFIWSALRSTAWGYEVRVIGANPAAARYAGMNLRRNIVTGMLIAGGLAGLAGMAVVAGVSHQLQDGISPGYGYMAIIVAFLGRGNPLGIVLVGVLFGGLQNGGQNLEMDGIPAAIVNMLEATLLFAVLAVQILTRYRLRRVMAPVPTPAEESVPAGAP